MTVVYHWEIGGDRWSTSANETLVIPSAGTFAFSSDAWRADCGTYYVIFVVTSPNAISARYDFAIVGPPPTPVPTQTPVPTPVPTPTDIPTPVPTDTPTP
jgi:hypothetical protein